MPYDIEKRQDGWAVVDAATREVAVVNGIPQTNKDRASDHPFESLRCEGLDIQDADDLVDLLNLMEAEAKTARLS